MEERIKPPFRFLTSEAFSALDIKEKALYIARAQKELEAQQQLLLRHRETFAVQVSAITELRNDDPSSTTGRRS